MTLYKDSVKSAWIGPKEKFCGSSFGTEPFEVEQGEVFVWFHSDGRSVPAAPFETRAHCIMLLVVRIAATTHGASS